MVGSVFGMEEDRFRLGIRKKFFPVEMVRHPVDAPSLGRLQARLDGAVSNLGWREVSLPIAGGWN